MKLACLSDEFTKRHPFNGTGYFNYFGRSPEMDSIWALPSGSKALLRLQEEGKTRIGQLSNDDIASLSPTQRRDAALWQQKETVIDQQGIREIIDSLDRPLYFYDYETVSSPVPFLQGTSPNQQVVVQYSLHVLDTNGSLRHSDGLIDHKTGDYKAVITKLLSEVDPKRGTFVVWYKGFENTRNREMAAMFPELADKLLAINAHTYDLMEVFSNRLYFDRRLKGSSSIKDVLPVVTDLSYEDLEVRGGGVASELIRQLIQGEVEESEVKKTRLDLLKYCERDTEAMVEIFNVLRSQT